MSSFTSVLDRFASKTIETVGLKGYVGNILRRAIKSQSGTEQLLLESPVIQELPISVAPHNTKLYRYLINRYLRRGVQFITWNELYSGKLSADQAYATIRHDVDFAPEKLSLLTDIDRECGVCSEIHIIVDGSHYDPAKYADEWRSLAAEGFKFGLHTLAPSEDDFFTKLRDEINQFDTLMGFKPPTFSIHGVCPSPDNWGELRRRFIERLQPRLASFGFAGSHNISGITRWIEDSGAGGEFAYLKGNWVKTVPNNGEVIGVLAHPDHWIDWPTIWHWDETSVTENPFVSEFIRDARASKQIS